jgi:hypothetical protein
VAEKLGPTPETVRNWVRRAEIDGGRRGITSDERERLKALERENRELRRANDGHGETGPLHDRRRGDAGSGGPVPGCIGSEERTRL